MNELNEVELNNTAGGFVTHVGIALLGAAAGAIISGWSDFKQGFQQAFWNQQKLAE